MRPDVLARLSRIARGDLVPVPGGTAGTPGTARVLKSPLYGTAPGTGHARNSPLFHVFQVFQPEHDELAEAERTAIAIVDGRVPEEYAGAWAAFQVRRPGTASAVEWFRAVDDAGRFLDEWAGLALDLGWRAHDIFGRDGLAWFCAGER